MSDPVLLVVAGPDGSGKSSPVTSSRLDALNGSIISPDNHARFLSVFRKTDR
jgi:predicted ABC-type ATPase